MFKEYHQSAKQLGFCSVGPDLGPNCLQRLTTQETGRQRVHAENRNLLFIPRHEMSTFLSNFKAKRYNVNLINKNKSEPKYSRVFICD